MAVKEGFVTSGRIREALKDRRDLDGVIMCKEMGEPCVALLGGYLEQY